MSLTLIQVKQKLYPHLPSGSSPLLSLEESSLGLDGFKRFLKETIDLETLELKNASLTKGTPANKIEITGTADFLGQVGLAVTFSILETGGKSSLRTSIHFPWPSEKPLPFGNYHLQKPQAEFLWMGKDNDENPILCGLISGNMQLDTLLAPVQIRFPSAPNSIFLKTGFKNPVSLNKGLQQLANIAQAPDLTTLLPNEAVNAIKGLALDQVGILFNTKTNKVNLVSLTVSATGWELVKGGFAIEDLRFSLQVAGIGSGNANITAELDADLVIEKTFRLPLFIRIEPGILSIGKRSTERFQLPGFGAILDALGEEDITDVMPNSFRKAAIAIDTLEIGFNTQAKKLNNVFFQVSMTGVKLEEHFILKYLGLGFRLERQGDSPKPKISGSFMCGLLLGTKNPVELDLHAMLSAGASGNSWQFDARAENINVSGLADIILEVFDADISLPAQLHELVIAELGLSFSKAAQAQNSQSDYKFTLEIKYPKNGQKADVSLTILLTKTDPSTTKPPTGNAQQNVQQPKTSGGYFVAVSGKIKVADKEFDLDLSEREDNQTNSSTGLLVLQTKNVSISLSSLASGLIDDPSIQSLIPQVNINPHYALVARLNKRTPTPPYPKTLMGLSLGLDIGLKGLPLVGKLLGNADFQVKDIQFIYATKNLDEADVQAINSLNPPAPLTSQPLDGISTGPAAAGSPGVPPNTAIVLAQGLGFKATILLGSLAPLQINMPARRSSTPAGKGKQQLQQSSQTTGNNTSNSGGPTQQGTGSTTTSPSPPGGDATWIDIQQAIGPVQFNRIGFRYKNKMIWGYLDAGLTLAGLTLSLDGLGVGNPINKFDPHFTLNGLGLDYSEGPVEIGGSFLRTTVPADTKNNIPAYDEYDGMAIMKMEMFSLMAIGSYAKVDGYDSLFLYAVLNIPLGGPPFLFVTGLAAGFGYNRAIRVPPISRVGQFPLVNEAVGGAGSTLPASNVPQTPLQAAAARRAILQTELAKLRTAIYPMKGQYFLAAGVHFTSFEMLDSFALLSVSFGQHFEVDVLGLSSMAVPTPDPNAMEVAPPLAEVQLALRAVFNPSVGILAIDALLTSNSYLFARACHLTGGFAFYVWFSGQHAGDFVVTLGGYHPRFMAPKHYPTVPRLGFNWTVSDKFSIKGGLYFALTAHALMAGGKLEALFHTGPIKAWFIIGADFIVSWQPYFYDARMYVDIGASFTFWLFGTRTITFELGADLHVWGPDFSGKATIHYYIVSFTISFGHGPGKPKPLKWEAFKTSFLPDDSKVLTVTAASGLVKEENMAKTNSKPAGKRYILNPKNMALTANSLVPVKTYELGLGKGASNGESQLYFADSGHQIILPVTAEPPIGNVNIVTTSDFGIAPMDVARVDTSNISITIKRDGTEDANTDFAFTPVLKRMPRAMWGDKLTAEVNGQQFIENALAGFEIRPAKPAKPGKTHQVLKANLQYEVDKQSAAFDCPGLSSYKSSGQVGPDTLKNIASLASQRNGLLQGLGFDTNALDLAPPADLDQIVVEKPLAATFTKP